MDYKRLTRKDERGFYHYNCTEKDQEDCVIYENCGECYGTQVLYRLAELEDKIEQGTLIELPCKVGSNVFYVVKSFKRNGQPSSAYYYTMLGRAVWANIPTIIRTWGDTTFATREEAKKRIEELQNG